MSVSCRDVLRVCAAHAYIATLCICHAALASSIPDGLTTSAEKEIGLVLSLHLQLQIEKTTPKIFGAVPDCVPWYHHGGAPADPAWGTGYTLIWKWMYQYYGKSSVLHTLGLYCLQWSLFEVNNAMDISIVKLSKCLRYAVQR